MSLALSTNRGRVYLPAFLMAPRITAHPVALRRAKAGLCGLTNFGSSDAEPG